MIKIKPIKTEYDYKNALNTIEKIWDAELNTEKGDYLEILVTLVEKYENEHFNISAPDPIEAIKFIMEQKDVKRTELEKILGSKSRVSEILNKQRKLNLRMIRNLHSALNIPYEILAEDYKLVKMRGLAANNLQDN